MVDHFLRTTGGNWSNPATWSTDTAARATGAAATTFPASSDRVFFDANSGNVTLTSNHDTREFTVADGYTGTFATGSNTFRLFNHVRLAAGMVLTGNGQWHFINGSLQFTVETNGVSLGGRTVLFGTNVNPGNHLLTTPLTVGVLQHGAGTLDTGGHNVTAGSLSSGGADVRTLTLRTSTVTLTGSGNAWNISGSNYTINGLDSTLVFTASGANIATGGIAMGTVRATATGDFTLTNSLVCTTFERIVAFANNNYNDGLQISAAQNLTATNLTIQGFSREYRIMVRAGSFGTRRSITCSGNFTTRDASFRDMLFSGAGVAAAADTGEARRTGDGHNNSGQPVGFFAPARTLRNVNTGTVAWQTQSAWNDDAGPVGVGPPLPQDTCVYGLGGAATMTAQGDVGGTLVLAGASDLLLNGDAVIYGSLEPTSAGIVRSASSTARTLNLLGRSATYTLLGTVGSSLRPVSLASWGNYSMTGTLNITLGTLLLQAGTLATNDHSVTAQTFGPSVSAAARNFQAGTSTISLYGTGLIWGHNDSGASQWGLTNATVVSTSTSAASRIVSNEAGPSSKIGRLVYTVNGGPLLIGNTASRTYTFGTIEVKGRSSDGTSRKVLNLLAVAGSTAGTVVDALDLGTADAFLAVQGAPHTQGAGVRVYGPSFNLPYVHLVSLLGFSNPASIGGYTPFSGHSSTPGPGANGYPYYRLGAQVTGQATPATSAVLNMGTSLAAGERIYIATTTDGAGTPTCPGFTTFSGPTPTGAGAPYLTVLTRTVEAGETATSHTVTFPASTIHTTALFVVGNVTADPTLVTTQQPNSISPIISAAVAVPKDRSLVMRVHSNSSGDRPLTSQSAANTHTINGSGSGNALSTNYDPVATGPSPTEYSTLTNGGSIQTLSLAFPGSYVVQTTTGLVKVQVGGSWVKKPAKVQVNGSWVTKPVKTNRNGTWTALP